MAARWGTRSPSYLSRCVMPRARLVVKQRDYRKPLPDDIRRRGTVAAISAIYSRRLRTESLHRQIAPAPKFGARRQTESRPKAGGVDEGPVVRGTTAYGVLSGSSLQTSSASGFAPKPTFNLPTQPCPASCSVG